MNLASTWRIRCSRQYLGATARYMRSEVGNVPAILQAHGWRLKLCIYSLLLALHLHACNVDTAGSATTLYLDNCLVVLQNTAVSKRKQCRRQNLRYLNLQACKCSATVGVYAKFKSSTHAPVVIAGITKLQNACSELWAKVVACCIVFVNVEAKFMTSSNCYVVTFR